MSNPLAIAAITATLRNLIYSVLSDQLEGSKITALPLDKARDNQEDNQVNLFLYHIASNLNWKNRPPIGQMRRGETKRSPLGLDLFYLITVYGEKEEELQTHQLLGKIMSLFHDTKKIPPALIEGATAQNLRESNLHEQIEEINITPLSLSFEEVLQIWQGFNAPYRTCVCYQVSVVLIDSQAALAVPMPVLSQNSGEGRFFQLDYLPTLTALELPNRQPAAQLGDIITLRGTNLDKTNLKVKFTHNQFKTNIELDPLAGAKSNELKVQIPNFEAETAHQWKIGLYIVTLICQEEEHNQQSNQLPLVLAPQITVLSPRETHEGTIRLRVNCAPPLHSKQAALLLWTDQVYQTRKRTYAGETFTRLTCDIPDVSVGEYVVRIRVDGVDNIPVDFSTFPWQFDRDQMIIIN